MTMTSIAASPFSFLSLFSFLSASFDVPNPPTFLISILISVSLLGSSSPFFWRFFFGYFPWLTCGHFRLQVFAFSLSALPVP
jgi:hypothetical protein